jgi:hypothetical protein
MLVHGFVDRVCVGLVRAPAAAAETGIDLEKLDVLQAFASLLE